MRSCRYPRRTGCGEVCVYRHNIRVTAAHLSLDRAVTSSGLCTLRSASRAPYALCAQAVPGATLVRLGHAVLEEPLLCRLARTLLEVLNARMAVRCGLLLVPQAAIERLKAEGSRMSLCASRMVGQSALRRCMHAQRWRSSQDICHFTGTCTLAGLQGAKGTAWQSLAASEKVAVAYAFIHEEDSRLALKFLARVMASFGGSQGDRLSWCTLTRASDAQHWQTQQMKQAACKCTEKARASEETGLQVVRMGLQCPHMQEGYEQFPDVGGNAGYDGSGGPDWQAASHAFRQTWGEVEDTDLSTAEAFKQVRAVASTQICFACRALCGCVLIQGFYHSQCALHGPRRAAQDSAGSFQHNAELS